MTDSTVAKMETVVKPCPRCGYVDDIKVFSKRTIFGNVRWMVSCHKGNCYYTEYVKSSSKEQAIEKWNKRCDKLNARGWREEEIE